jgi:RNA polymerase sigma-70 factor (ECF subfamily)
LLYDRYRKKIYLKSYSFSKNTDEANDLTQEIFIKMFDRLDSYQRKSKFSTWFYSLAYNFLVNYKKRDSPKKLGERWERLNAKEEYAAALDNFEEEDFLEIKSSKLEKALELIEPADKALLMMKYQDEISIEDMQLLLHIGESAIKMRLKRARNRLIKAFSTINL